MNPPFLLFSLVVVGSFVSGCGETQATSPAVPAHAPAATYKEGQGLSLSPTGARFANVTVAPLSSRRFGESSSVAALPASALLRTIKGDFVYVTNESSFLRTAVRVGRREGEWIEVLDGLYEGDVVVVSGVAALWLAEIHAVNGGVGCAHGH